MQLSAQTGAFIASAAAEANFKVSMTWRRGTAQPEGAGRCRRLLDFDVAIEPLDDGYRARVVASPAGEADADFALPFTDKDLGILVLKVVGSIGRVRRKVRRIESEERRLLEDFGGQLFQAVFSGPVRECLGRSRLVADSRDAGLRIRLRLPRGAGQHPVGVPVRRRSTGSSACTPRPRWCATWSCLPRYGPSRSALRCGSWR